MMCTPRILESGEEQQDEAQEEEEREQARDCPRKGSGHLFESQLSSLHSSHLEHPSERDNGSEPGSLLRGSSPGADPRSMPLLQQQASLPKQPSNNSMEAATLQWEGELRALLAEKRFEEALTMTPPPKAVIR